MGYVTSHGSPADETDSALPMIGLKHATSLREKPHKATLVKSFSKSCFVALYSQEKNCAKGPPAGAVAPKYVLIESIEVTVNPKGSVNVSAPPVVKLE